jgi:hypothetical protein
MHTHNNVTQLHTKTYTTHLYTRLKSTLHPTHYQAHCKFSLKVSVNKYAFKLDLKESEERESNMKGQRIPELRSIETERAETLTQVELQPFLHVSRSRAQQGYRGEGTLAETSTTNTLLKKKT